LRIGEPQSKLADWSKCIHEPNGEVYEGAIFKLLGRPFDTGRLFYAKLRNAAPRNASVEVYWNHFDDELTGVIAGRSFEVELVFIDPVMARTDKIVYIEAIIDRLKEKASSLPQRS
jgi:hypothetical protein